MPRWRSSCSSPDRWIAGSRRWRCSSTTPSRSPVDWVGCSPARIAPGKPPSPPGLGLERPAVEVSPDFDFWRYLVGQLTAGERIDYLVCDETQFYLPQQIDQLARIVDELGVDVFAVGILTDFRTLLFPGSRRLVELADRIETLQVRSLCWCGKRATHNARTVGGRMVTEGAQVVVGDTVPDGDGELSDQSATAYEVLCRDHHRAGRHPGRGPDGADGSAALRARGRCPVSNPLVSVEHLAAVLDGGGRGPGDRAGRRPLDAERPTRSARVRGRAPARRGLRGPGVRADHPRTRWAVAIRCRTRTSSNGRCGGSGSRPRPRSSSTTARPRWPRPGCGGC